eukprot:TRINITY_DN1297_c0_g1_i3.p1 TRINITY_DN1297_c0_g1~~TRINITY_DN1297_c0_g1_i3.p1  ORF type:complete len:484 (-),score=123.34 TRINITY_DN1297_c0_g1_i3:228-1655(-)
MNVFTIVLGLCLVFCFFEVGYGASRPNSFYSSNKEFRDLNVDIEVTPSNVFLGSFAEKDTLQFVAQVQVISGDMALQVLRRLPDQEQTDNDDSVPVVKMQIIYEGKLSEYSTVYANLPIADKYDVNVGCSSKTDCSSKLVINWDIKDSCATKSNRDDCISDENCGWSSETPVEPYHPKVGTSYPSYDYCVPYLANKSVTNASAFETNHIGVGPKIDSFYFSNNVKFSLDNVRSQEVHPNSFFGLFPSQKTKQFVAQAHVLNGKMKITISKEVPTEETNVESPMPITKMKILYEEELSEFNTLFANMIDADDYNVNVECLSPGNQADCHVKFSILWNDECSSIGSSDQCEANLNCGWSTNLYTSKSQLYNDCVPYLATKEITRCETFTTKHVDHDDNSDDKKPPIVLIGIGIVIFIIFVAIIVKFVFMKKGDNVDNMESSHYLANDGNALNPAGSGTMHGSSGYIALKEDSKGSMV